MCGTVYGAEHLKDPLYQFEAILCRVFMSDYLSHSVMIICVVLSALINKLRCAFIACVNTKSHDHAKRKML